jgi:hypothetical protein
VIVRLSDHIKPFLVHRRFEISISHALDLSKNEQRADTEGGVAEKICLGLAPGLFHGGEERVWFALVAEGHCETYAVDGAWL